MTVEQVARDFVAQMADLDIKKDQFTPDAMVSGGPFPTPLSASDSIGMMRAWKTAFPDLQFKVNKVTVNGNQARVEASWSGTNTGTLNLPMPGVPALPPTGKRVNVKDSYLVTVQGDKVSHMEVQSPSDGGIPAALGQLGVKVPGM